MWCMPLQPLNSAKQESDSASLSDVTLEGETDSCNKACALATGVLKGHAATWA